jgi:hypothetical protein
VRRGEPLQHELHLRRHLAQGRGPARRTSSATLPPSASSIVYHDVPPRSSKSKIGTMAGWASCAASVASRRKRATAPRRGHARVQHLERHLAPELEVAHRHTAPKPPAA